MSCVSQSHSGGASSSSPSLHAPFVPLGLEKQCPPALQPIPVIVVSVEEGDSRHPREPSSTAIPLYTTHTHTHPSPIVVSSSSLLEESDSYSHPTPWLMDKVLRSECTSKCFYPLLVSIPQLCSSRLCSAPLEWSSPWSQFICFFFLGVLPNLIRSSHHLLLVPYQS